MYFVLGSIVIVYASFFGYIAKKVLAGAENTESATAEETEAVMQRSLS
jgi:hypothetical protein